MRITTTESIDSESKAAQLHRASMLSTPLTGDHSVETTLDSLMTDLRYKLTPTARVILMFLSHVKVARVEDIARFTGSRYRWVEVTAMRLVRVGILRRVGPNSYAIHPDREVRQ